jgi:hypothetical protein
MKQKMEEGKKSKTYITFVNKHSAALMARTPADVIYELGLRAFTGSRDLPKDVEKAVSLL